MSESDVLFECLNHLREAVGLGISNNFAGECEKLTFEESGPCGVISDDKVAIVGGVWDTHEFFLARLHPHRNKISIEFLLESHDMSGFEVRGYHVGWVCGRDEALALHVSRRASLSLLLPSFCSS